jgi:hypothetical protein
MAIYEVEHNGKVYEVDAPSPEAAAGAFAPQPTQEAQSKGPSSRPRVGEPHKKASPLYTPEDALALGDTALALGTSGVSSVAGGFAGAVAGAGHAVGKIFGADGSPLDTAALVNDFVLEKGTYKPKTKQGREALETAGKYMEAGLTEIRDRADVDEKFYGVKGLSPTLETIILAAPEMFGMGKLKGARSIRKAAEPDQSEAAKAAARLKINLENNKIRESTVDAARDMTSGQGRATSGGEAIPEAIIEARDTSQKAVDSLYDRARAGTAEAPAEPLVALATQVEDELIKRGADFGQDTRLTARMNDLRKIREQMIGPPENRNTRQIPGQSSTILGPDGKPLVAPTAQPTMVPLQELGILDERISNDITRAYASGNKPEARHLRRMQARLRGMLEDKAYTDLMKGNPADIAAWKNARAANRLHQKTFNDDKIIKKLTDETAPAKEVMNLVFGTAELGYRPRAVQLVRKLKDIMGENPVAMESLRGAVYADLFDPLFKGPEPNWKGTMERIRRRKRDDSALLRELGISQSDLEFMAKAARVASQVTTKEDLLKNKAFWSTMAARWSFGHEISKAGARQKLVNLVFDKALGVGQKTHNQLLKEFASDPDAPLLTLDYPKLKGYYARGAAITMAQDRMDGVNDDEDE